MTPKVLICLAGADLPVEARAAWARRADFKIAADAGAERLQEGGLAADLVIGDFDSSVQDGYARIHHDHDQDTSDFEKALAYAEAHHIEHEVLAMCIEGDRLDHVLVNCLAAARSRLRPSLASRAGLGVWLTAGKPLVIEILKGTRLSMIPIEECVATMSNVKWAYRNRRFGLQHGWSISNEALGPVEASVSEGTALLIIDVPAGTWPSDLVTRASA